MARRQDGRPGDARPGDSTIFHESRRHSTIRPRKDRGCCCGMRSLSIDAERPTGYKWLEYQASEKLLRIGRTRLRNRRLQVRLLPGALS